jgi:hypothetical protein
MLFIGSRRLLDELQAACDATDEDARFATAQQVPGWLDAAGTELGVEPPIPLAAQAAAAGALRRARLLSSGDVEPDAAVVGAAAALARRIGRSPVEAPSALVEAARAMGPATYTALCREMGRPDLAALITDACSSPMCLRTSTRSWSRQWAGQSVSVICPITHQPLRLPSRGALCAHAQPFCLAGFVLVALQRPAALQTCPICAAPLRDATDDAGPSTLYVDRHVLAVLARTSPKDADVALAL